MMWNVLWMAAMAAASAVAGFCMGRLSGGAGGFYGEEEENGKNAGRQSAWEAEAAGEMNVRIDGGEWDAGEENRWIRMSERAERELTADERPAGAAGVLGGQRR